MQDADGSMWMAAERYGYDIAYEHDLAYISRCIARESKKARKREALMFGEARDSQMWTDSCYISAMLEIYAQVEYELFLLTFDEGMHRAPVPTIDIVGEYILEREAYLEEKNLHPRVQIMLYVQMRAAKELSYGTC